MKLEKIKSILDNSTIHHNKWELNNIVWVERLSNPIVLAKFLERIDFLNSLNIKSKSEEVELKILLELLEDVDEDKCINLLTVSEDDEKHNFIENLARVSAVEILTSNKLTTDTLSISCKLSPNDFILCAKRTQEIINSVREIVIKGENLASYIPGA